MLLHLYGAGQPCVFPQDFGIQNVGQQEQYRTHNRDPVGKGAPTEAEIQTCQYETDKEHQTAAFDHHRLLCFRFLCLQPMLQQRRIFDQHHKTCRKHGNEQDPHQQPSAEISQSACRKKNQHTHQHHAQRKLADSLQE